MFKELRGNVVLMHILALILKLKLTGITKTILKRRAKFTLRLTIKL